MTEREYTAAFAELAHRTARIGLYIDVEDTRPGDAGPFVLRNASFGEDDGYDAHCGGCDLEMIELCVRHMELENRLYKGARELVTYGVQSIDQVVEQLLADISIEAQAAALGADFNLESVCRMAAECAWAELR